MSNWKIEHEGNHWTVYERHTAGDAARNPGDVTWAGRSFHATAEQACNSLLNRLSGEELVAADVALTGQIETVLQAIAQAEQRVKQAIQGGTK